MAITVVRAGRLSWRLFCGVPRQRIPLDRMLDGSVAADDLARAALANLVSHEAPSAGTPRAVARGAAHRPGCRPAHAAGGGRPVRLSLAPPDYSRVVDVEPDAPDAHRGGVHHGLRVLSHVGVLHYGDRAGGYTIAGLPAYIVKALYEAGEWSLARLSLGLGVAGGLCVVAMVFDGLLQRRLASWKYCYATARDALSGGQRSSEYGNPARPIPIQSAASQRRDRRSM